MEKGPVPLFLQDYRAILMKKKGPIPFSGDQDYRAILMKKKGACPLFFIPFFHFLLFLQKKIRTALRENIKIIMNTVTTGPK